MGNVPNRNLALTAATPAHLHASLQILHEKGSLRPQAHLESAVLCRRVNNREVHTQIREFQRSRGYEGGH